jgi:hypothetical protein
VDTTVPLQRLFLLNSDMMHRQSEAFAARLDHGAGHEAAEAKVKRAYRLLFQRDPENNEMQAALVFLKHNESSWAQYAQILLSSNEFLYVE